MSWASAPCPRAGAWEDAGPAASDTKTRPRTASEARRRGEVRASCMTASCEGCRAHLEGSEVPKRITVFGTRFDGSTAAVRRGYPRHSSRSRLQRQSRAAHRARAAALRTAAILPLRFRHGRVDVEEVHVGISSYAPRLGVHEPGAATGLDDERPAAGDRANPLHVKSRRRPIERKLLDDVVDRLVQALP